MVWHLCVADQISTTEPFCTLITGEEQVDFQPAGEIFKLKKTQILIMSGGLCRTCYNFTHLLCNLKIAETFT